MVKMGIKGMEILTVLDTGAAASIIPEWMRRELEIPLRGSMSRGYKGIGGVVPSIGYVVTRMNYKDQLDKEVRLGIVDLDIDYMILGNDVLKDFNVTVNYEDEKVILEDVEERRKIWIPVKFMKRDSDIESSDEEDWDDWNKNEEKEKDESIQNMEIMLTNIEELEKDLKEEIWKNELRNKTFIDWKEWLMEKLRQMDFRLAEWYREYEQNKGKVEIKQPEKIIETLQNWLKEVEKVIPELRYRQEFCKTVIKRILDWIGEQQKKGNFK